jgi:23S rRNA (cytidine1920-2'-O)/16S rRNA (cytidine1409-2'-O)-methyltransferase
LLETNPQKKKRIDQLLVDRGLAETRSQAQALLIAGKVLVNEQKIEKPGHAIAADADIRLLEQLPYASRAGAKLAAALDHFAIQVAGRVCADLGASTGGFTDCLLQRGARAVHAYDVGSGLLAWKLRTDPRVVMHDGYNVRNIVSDDLPAGLSLVVGDLSFISLKKIMLPLKDALFGLGRNSREAQSAAIDLVLLVKPQFEVGKGEVGKGGIVRDHNKQIEALRSVEGFALSSGYCSVGNIPSPVVGSKGNQEFLLILRLIG